MNRHLFILIALKALAVLLLVLLNGFFVAAEFAFVRIRETQLDALAAKGRRRARVAQHIVRQLNSYLSATQLGVTMASLGLGFLGEPLFATLLDPLLIHLGVGSEVWQHSISIAFGFSALTFLSIVVGELGPKWLTMQKTLPVALWSAQPLRWFYLAFYPFNWLLNASARGLMRWLGLETDRQGDHTPSEDELRLVLAAVPQAAPAAGRNLILNALDLRQRVARDIMRPRQAIVAFSTEATLAECLKLAESSRYSRFPLCDDGDLDKTRGLVHIKDLYAAREKARTAADLLALARPLIFVPETSRLERLLQLFLDRKLHFAIIVDEYGGTLGAATLEDVLEELVGPIQDEFDSEETPKLARAGENVWEAAGTLPLHELEGIIGLTQREETVATVSGWVTQRLGGFPKVGDTLTVGNCELRVEALEGTRVARLKITKRAEPPSPEI